MANHSVDGLHFERLKSHILSLSEADEFELACKEWSLVEIELSQEWATCPCGQDIKEHCFILNRVNGNKTHVGNVCIDRFDNMDTNNLFEGLRRIAKDETANANESLIDHVFSMGYLFEEREYNFLKRMIGKRSFTPAQMSWKVKLNRKILSHTKVIKRSELKSLKHVP